MKTKTNTKMKTNKTKTVTTAAYQFDFTPCDEAMLHHYNSGITLRESVVKVWNSAPAAERIAKPFRDQFTVWALKAKYGETHIRRTLGSFEFLELRKKTGNANKTKAGKKQAASKEAVVSLEGVIWELKFLIKNGKKTEVKKMLTEVLASL